MRWLFLFLSACATVDTDVHDDTEVSSERACGAAFCGGGDFCLSESPGEGGEATVTCEALPSTCLDDQTCACVEAATTCISCTEDGGFVRCENAYP